jgi:hypothetical protein
VKGAGCKATVTYLDRKHPVSARKWTGIWHAVPSGVERLTWLEEMQSSGGQAVVMCRYRRVMKSAIASFKVVNA